MRCGLSDLCRIRRTVNAVRTGGQINPDQANGILRTRSDGEGFVRSYAPPGKPRIVVVIWIPGDASHFKSASWCGPFLAANGGGIEAKELSHLVIGAHVARRFIDHDCHHSFTATA
jgi:hypothetical protein